MSSTESPRLPDFAARGVGAIAAVAAVLLFALSARYGYHRDELYFIACGRHLSWGYPDQPVLTPLLARLMTDLSPTSLVVLRLPSDLAAATTLVFTGLTARELGFARPVQVLATGAMALSNLVLATGHLLSTSTFDLTAWTVLIWVGLRALRSGNDRWWLLAGSVAGVGLLNSDLVFFLTAAVLVGLAVAGPRNVLRSPWLLAGVLVALAAWTPYLVWQGRHGWPEFAVANSIAHGGSATSAPRWAFLPEQLLTAGPWLAPFIIVGVVVLWRRPELRWARAFSVALVFLVVAFIATDGKPYYLDGMFPIVFAAGADAIWSWVRRSERRRRAYALAAMGVFSLPNMVITLPMLPIADLHGSIPIALDSDVGETVGWPAFVSEIAGVYHRTDQRLSGLGVGGGQELVLLTSNYGEGGAIDRYGPSLGLPAAYGVQNAFWLWGPPPATATTAIAVGFDRSQLTPIFRFVALATRLNNHVRVNDDEQGEPVYVCSEMLRPWTEVWRSLRDYG